jgi:hypothetical protein
MWLNSCMTLFVPDFEAVWESRTVIGRRMMYMVAERKLHPLIFFVRRIVYCRIGRKF